MIIQLHKWQQEALNIWQSKGFGTIEAATATGKTKLAIAAIKENKTSTIIVVPTEHLMMQWKKELLDAGCPENLIGLYNGKHKQIERKYVIGVINSLIKTYFNVGLLVLDECHKYSSPTFKQILDKKYSKLLALSATPEREDNMHHILLSKAPVIFRYTTAQAIADGIISNYQLKEVPLFLDEKQQLLLENLDNKIRYHFRQYDFIQTKRLVRQNNQEAIQALKNVQERKYLLCHNEVKINFARELCKKLLANNPAEKIIVFTEYIETAEAIAKDLQGAFIYHSSLTRKDKEDCLNSFKMANNGILACVRALDEGLNVPNCTTGIVLAGCSVKRQFQQRLGRILRLKASDAVLYQLYIANSKDEDWLIKRTRN